MNYIEATTFITRLPSVGPFQTVAYHNAHSVYESASCSCGWQFVSPAIDPHKRNEQVAKMCAHHMSAHVNYNCILTAYVAGIFTYAGAREHLMHFGMSEDRADETLDASSILNVVTHMCNSMCSSDGSGSAQVKCHAYRTTDGKFHSTCGEPCRWGMMTLGHGNPPWTEADRT